MQRKTPSDEEEYKCCWATYKDPTVSESETKEACWRVKIKSTIDNVEDEIETDKGYTDVTIKCSASLLKTTFALALFALFL